MTRAVGLGLRLEMRRHTRLNTLLLLVVVVLPTVAALKVLEVVVLEDF
jgi:hypothetical protein